MEIEISTPALLFPAISLLLLAYTNRFLALARIIRELVAGESAVDDSTIRTQLRNLRLRVNLIKWMQAFGVCSLTMCTLSMFFLFYKAGHFGSIAFGISLVLMVLSLLLSLWEILLSSDALEVKLHKFDESL